MTTTKNHPQGVPISIKYPEIPLYSFLENHARKYPQRSATIFFDKKLSYSKIWDETLRFANSLKKLGVKKGDRIGLLLPNTPHFLIAFNAIFVVGGIAVPINPLNPLVEITRELDYTECKILIILDRLLDKLPTTFSGTIIIAKGETYVALYYKILSRLSYKRKSIKGVFNFEDLVKESPINQLAIFNVKEDVAVILHTSGTTGDPKGVMLTHYNLVANALQSYHWLRGWGYSSKPQKEGWPIILCAVPFFHSYGLNIMNEALSYGCSLVLIPDPQPKIVLESIKKHNITHLPLIPRFVSEILKYKNLDKYDLKKIIMSSSGGASISPELIKKFEDITDSRFYQGYGLTEAGPVTHATPVEGKPNYLSPGFPYPDTEAKIVDLQIGEIEMQKDREGELIVKGPQIMKGYWKLPEENANALRKGWLYTGDIAKIDEDGWLYILGRKRERIISDGHTVWPIKVEEVILSYPGIENVIAFGTPDPLRCSTDIVAFIVVGKEFNNIDIEDKILTYCKEKLQPFEVPSKIKIVPNLPLTPMGKVDRIAVEAEIEKNYKT
ncbi:AMP-binding protein [Candidatus Bathyarchaeota archaeon]|nr:AMP-binding protein [Candidatus Bathyarchaeota archaeon]